MERMVQSYSSRRIEWCPFYHCMVRRIVPGSPRGAPTPIFTHVDPIAQRRAERFLQRTARHARGRVSSRQCLQEEKVAVVIQEQKEEGPIRPSPSHRRLSPRSPRPPTCPHPIGMASATTMSRQVSCAGRREEVPGQEG
jgi:hypothetical protein